MKNEGKTFWGQTWKILTHAVLERDLLIEWCEKILLYNAGDRSCCTKLGRDSVFQWWGETFVYNAGERASFTKLWWDLLVLFCGKIFLWNAVKRHSFTMIERKAFFYLAGRRHSCKILGRDFLVQGTYKKLGRDLFVQSYEETFFYNAKERPCKILSRDLFVQYWGKTFL